MHYRTLAHGRWLIALLGMSLVLILSAPSTTRAQSPVCSEMVTDGVTYTGCWGDLADGRAYGFEVPTDWNHKLVFIGTGYVAPGTPPPGSATLPPGTNSNSWVLNVFKDPVYRWMVANGYAVATAFGGTGWAVHEDLRNDLETLDIFASLYGTPDQTIAYGVSLAGLTTVALVEQHPDRFQGGLAISGVVGGGIAAWNQGLDMAFVVKRLLAPNSALAIVSIGNPGTPYSGNWGLARNILAVAQNSAIGRARIALASAMDDIPGWIDPTGPEPAADDYAARELYQYLWLREGVSGFFFGYGRNDLEARAGGNPSWNTGVDYRAQLERSVNYAEVVALYQAAGLSLDNDLARLAAAPRIAADPAAVEYLRQNIEPTGQLGDVPVLTLHSTGDGVAVVQHEAAYRSAVLSNGDAQSLRQAFVHRASHAVYSPAELLAAFQVLLDRMDTGKWQAGANPEKLNATALAFGSSYNMIDPGDGSLIPTAPAFFEYEPAPMLRSSGLDGDEPILQPGSPATPVAPPAADATAPADAPLVSAWPLPYRGGSLQVTLSPRATFGSGARVGIYDLAGRLVRQLALSGGTRSLRWDGRDAGGSAVGNGVYFLRAAGAGQRAQLKILVLR